MMINMAQLAAGLAVPCGNYPGAVIREGNSAIRLEGGFETEDFVPVLVWNVALLSGPEKRYFWPVYEKSCAEELRYIIRKLDDQSGRILYQMCVGEADLTEPKELDRGLNTVKDGRQEAVRYQIVLEVKSVKAGSGAEKEGKPQDEPWLRIGPIHLYSTAVPWCSPAVRKDTGKNPQEILREKEANPSLRMERIVTPDRCEVFAFYRKGDGKPPLQVLFAGTKKSSLELAEKILEKSSSPCLLLEDARLQGEGFWFGTEGYEAAIQQIIERHLKELDFNGQDAVLSGISFGAAGALYYGAGLNPSPWAILLAEPVLNTGSMIMREKLARNGAFPKSLDMYLLMRHDFGLEEDKSRSDLEKALNDHLWDRIRKGRFPDTEIAVYYMQEDEYDGSAFEDLRRLLSTADQPVRIYGKKRSGRHIPEEDPAISSAADWLERQMEYVVSKRKAQDHTEGIKQGDGEQELGQGRIQSVSAE